MLNFLVALPWWGWIIFAIEGILFLFGLLMGLEKFFSDEVSTQDERFEWRNNYVRILAYVLWFPGYYLGWTLGFGACSMVMGIFYFFALVLTWIPDFVFDLVTKIFVRD